MSNEQGSNSMKSVRLDIQDGTAILTLNQPSKHNAFDDHVIAQLLEYLHQVSDRDDVRLLILQAEGKHFCAGADLAWMKRIASMSHQENLEDARQLATLMYTLNNLPMPSIARIQGAAYGGAIGLIACCDIAIAADNARFCLSEARLGLAPATIAPYVYASIGERICRRLFLTSEVFEAKQAVSYGLLHESVPLDDLDATIASLQSKILETGPEASKACKALIRDITNDSTELFNDTSELIARLRVSDEGQEGLSAFFEKRRPRWQ